MATTVTAGLDEGVLETYEADVAETDGAGDLVTARSTPYYVEADLASDEAFRTHHRERGLQRMVPAAQADPGRRTVRARPPQRRPPTSTPDTTVPVGRQRALGGVPAEHRPGGRPGAGPARRRPPRPRGGGLRRCSGRVGRLPGSEWWSTRLTPAAWLYDSDGRLLHESAAATRWTRGRNGIAVRAAGGPACHGAPGSPPPRAAGAADDYGLGRPRTGRA